jgi:large subunit ribosomal protein LP0
MVRHRPPKRAGGQDNEGRVFAQKKVNYFAQANKYFDEYSKIIVILTDNVQSKQMQQIRIALRGEAVIMMGKNTTIKKILLDRCGNSPRDEQLYDILVTKGLLKLNVGLIFTNGDLNKIKDICDANKIQSAARQGNIAQCDVVIPPGNTGLEPTKTQFFQALNINTKITKGTVEILKDEPILTKGDRVGQSEATLLQMLGVKPFYYGIQLLHIYDNGALYTRQVLDMTDDDMKKIFEAGVANVTAVSLATNITTEASIAHVMANAFKECLAVTVGTDYVMESCNGAELREAIISGKGLGGGGGGAPAAAAAAPAAAAAAAPVVEEEDDDDDMGMDLFD